LRFSVEAAAIVAGAPSDRRAALVRYGTALGAAFQVADDILDAESTDAVLGKRAGKDAERNKATFVSVHGLTAAKALRDELVEKALDALDEAALGRDGDGLRAAARFVAQRRN
jgi:farnesyl diphosphate synthase